MQSIFVDVNGRRLQVFSDRRCLDLRGDGLVNRVPKPIRPGLQLIFHNVESSRNGDGAQSARQVIDHCVEFMQHGMVLHEQDVVGRS